MRLTLPVVVGLLAGTILLALAVTEQVLPAGTARAADLRPWLAARALGVTAYLLLALDVTLGLLLAHPRNHAAWRSTRASFPWHQLVTVFTLAFLVLHVVILAVDPLADVGVVGALVPGRSGYRPEAVAIGTVAFYALLVTAISARWTRLLPGGWWLRLHRFAAVAFVLAWVHSVLAGTDTAALTPLYVATGIPVLAALAHRWWSASSGPRRAAPASGGSTLLGGPAGPGRGAGAAPVAPTPATPALLRTARPAMEDPS